jgi:hypothetical protein
MRPKGVQVCARRRPGLIDGWRMTHAKPPSSDPAPPIVPPASAAPTFGKSPTAMPPAAAAPVVKLAPAAAPVGDMPDQTAQDRKAAYAAEETEPASCALTRPIEEEDRELTSEDQDQILHLALWLLSSVDQRHRKKFYTHLVESSVDGVYLPTCGHRGWKAGGYPIDASLLAWLHRAQLKQLNTVDNGPVVEPVHEAAPAPETARERKKADHKLKHAEMLEALANGTAGDACIMRELAREQEARERAKALEPTAEAALDPGIPVFLRRTRPEVAP